MNVPLVKLAETEDALTMKEATVASASQGLNSPVMASIVKVFFFNVIVLHCLKCPSHELTVFLYVNIMRL